MNQENFKIPNNWSELKLLLDYISYCTPDCLRLDEDQKFYTILRNLISRDIFIEIINQQIGNQDCVIVKNNFPYTKLLKNLKNVTHFCLWNRKGRLNQNQIAKKVKEQFGECVWCYSERKPTKKTVPEIWHCHIFVKED